jgi:hypothetical protein
VVRTPCEGVISGQWSVNPKGVSGREVIQARGREGRREGRLGREGRRGRRGRKEGGLEHGRSGGQERDAVS